MELVEMERNGKRHSAGKYGGRMWMEEDQGERINDLRTDQAIAVQAAGR